MLKDTSILIALITASFVISTHSAEDEWEKYSAKEYGFEMLIPKGVKFLEREKSGGWGGLYGTYEGVKLYALAKLGAEETKDDIRKFAEKECGIPGENWKRIDSGKDSSGWKWYEIYVAEKGDTLIFGGFGVGPKGNYLAFLKTTKSDYEEHKADYKEWFESIKLQ
jgi:hypothetical protein